MINFVIVEDNEYQRRSVCKIVNKFMMNNDHNYKVHEFNDFTEDLITFIKNTKDYNIYILDYELPSGDALDICRLIREKDWISPIIINTVHASLGYETFKQKLLIFDFINKADNMEKELSKALYACLKQFKKKPKTFRFKIRGIDYNIEYDKILYIYRETFERKLVLVTDTNKFKMNKNIRDIIKILDDNRFKITHRACIVNMNRVQALIWKEKKIVFDNKEEIFLLSNTHKKELENNVVV